MTSCFKESRGYSCNHQTLANGTRECGGPTPLDRSIAEQFLALIALLLLTAPIWGWILLLFIWVVRG